MSSSDTVTHAVTLVPGDGVGPDVTTAARRVLDATGVQFEWDVQEAGEVTVASEGTALPQRVLRSIRERGVALKGPLATAAAGGGRSANIALREALDLYVGVRPTRSRAGAPSRFADVDVVTIRMTGEDLYAGIEIAQGTAASRRVLELIAGSHDAKLPGDTGFTLKPLAASTARRVARAAFAFAREHGRGTVTVVHKANVMRVTDGAFLDAAREVAAEFPDVACDDRLVDAVCHDLVVRPETFDVLLAPVMYGDLLSDLCAGLTGGLGLAPGASYGDDYAVFEPVHGTGIRISRNLANPMAAILSGAMLLRHVGEFDAANRVVTAVEAVLSDGVTLTYDLRPMRAVAGAATTDEVTEAVIAALDRPRHRSDRSTAGVP